MPKKKCSVKELSEEFYNLSKIKENNEQKCKFIGLLKRTRSCWSRSKNKTDKADEFLILAVSLRAYLDYLKLKRIMSLQNELKASNKKIVSAWSLLCDLKDRQHFLSNYTNGDALKKMQGFSSKVDMWFLSNFGKGIYSSPELISKSVDCSICGENLKACSHIPGRLYNGISCYSNPRECYIHRVSIVKNPRDLRCRMLPWEYDEKGDGTMETRILTAFSVDDFLYNNDWEKSV